MKKAFNAIKKEEFPFVVEVTKYATQQPFINLGKAFKKFFEDLKKGIVSYPQFKKKRITKVVSILAVTRFHYLIQIAIRRLSERYHTTENRSISILNSPISVG